MSRGGGGVDHPFCQSNAGSFVALLMASNLSAGVFWCSSLVSICSSSLGLGLVGASGGGLVVPGLGFGEERRSVVPGFGEERRGEEVGGSRVGVWRGEEVGGSRVGVWRGEEVGGSRVGVWRREEVSGSRVWVWRQEEILVHLFHSLIDQTSLTKPPRMESSSSGHIVTSLD